MLETPLRIGVLGSTADAHGIAHQVNATAGMELAWHFQSATESSQSLAELAELFAGPAIDVFYLTRSGLSFAAQAALLALSNHAHLILSDPRLQVALGLRLQAEAYQKGLIISADAGSAHGSLASMIQEAHIMGFETVQAGQICPAQPSPNLPYEMAALGNGFGFQPHPAGMRGAEITSPEDILTRFDHSYPQGQGAPQLDYLRCSGSQRGLYLIVKAREKLTAEQVAHLKKCHVLQVGDLPYFLLKKNPPLGYFEGPKAILAAAAGQAILSPGYPSCDVYQDNAQQATLRPYQEDLIPHYLIPEDSKLSGESPHLEDLTLTDSALTQLWVEQRKIIAAQP